MLDRSIPTTYRQDFLPFTVPLMADNDNLINILMVEDNDSDSVLATQRINATHIPHNLQRVTRGDDVMPYLKNCLQTRLPDVIFLDLGLPDSDGFDILQELAMAPSMMRAIPIAIMTGWKNFDYLPSYFHALPIYGCLNKPLQIDKMEAILSKVTLLR